jgi:RNA polymerase sigma-70 factor, ECF subfamily
LESSTQRLSFDAKGSPVETGSGVRSAALLPWLEEAETMVDEEIIRSIKAGEVDCYALLVEKYHKPLLSFIHRIVADEDLVEDIGQEVFFTVYRSLDSFDLKRGVPFSAWLFTSARNRCISVLRERRAGSRVGLEAIDLLADAGQNPEEMLLEREQMAALGDCLGQVPEPFRKAIVMSLNGNSLEQIAASEGVSIGTVKSRLFRAKERIRLHLELYFGAKRYGV